MLGICLRLTQPVIARVVRSAAPSLCTLSVLEVRTDLYYFGFIAQLPFEPSGSMRTYLRPQPTAQSVRVG